MLNIISGIRFIFLSHAFLLILTGTACFGQAGKPGGLKFKKQVLTTDFVSEGVATGDVNKDGKTDILAGAFWFEAPGWERHELAEPKTFSTTEYSNSCLNFSMDVNRDGWADLVRFVFPGSAVVWHENPRNRRGAKEHWKIDTIHYSAGNESPGMYDVNGDGRPDLLCSDLSTREIIWLQAPLRKRDGWKKFAISDTMTPGSDIFSHGLGLGDVNGDGRRDILVKEGWWEAPGDPGERGWTFHPANFGEDCSQMYAMDVDGDGDQDVISASAHKYGIWWHEQAKDAAGGPSWKTHEISKAFSQSHALSLADMNGDGHPDLVSGKRYFAHNGLWDPGEHDPAVLYWFEFRPGKPPYWKAHEIDNDSGAGLNIVTRDMNGDNLTDIVIANKKGVFFFEQEER
ncbi:MAG TPA: FG-GAP-like repeat-containing protein [Anseongella sp.]|nr:FG-GAP-like repeat-containing protein [Anseongella sp.]